MKLKREDKVVVITGRDRGKTGKIMAILSSQNKVVVEGVNIMKRHTKPSKKLPRGGILDITKPIDASKVMALDPQTGKPARIGYTLKSDGTKERIFKVSRNHQDKKMKATDSTQQPTGAEKKADKK